MNSKEVENIIERLDKVAKSIFGSLSAMAVDMGKSPSFFSSYKSQGKPFGMKLLLELRHKYEINPNYILEGERPVFIKDGTPGEPNSHVVEVSHIKTVQEVVRVETDSDHWNLLCSKYGFDSMIKKAYKVNTNGRDIYYTEKQFEEVFKYV